jgi:DNA helicase-2/ATP-dependent DNA helicase PcrA
MSRTRGRREPSPLEQIPFWDGFVSDVQEAIAGDPPAGLDALLGGLNPEQLRAVSHGEGPLLVVAGAGTGKTQVITRRIAWLIATRRARPSEILALTFTEKAAAEMQARVDQLVPYGYTDASIGTFHAFGDRVIREYALELGLPTDVRVLTRPEVVIFLREHLFEFDLDEYRPLGDPTRFLGALATLFSRCKDEDVSPQAYLAHADELAIRSGADPDDEALAEDARRHGELARAYARYQELLAAAGFIDFGDQVSLALRLVRSSAAARAELRSRFRYVLVDEFQDTNRAQSELVSILAEPHRNVTVVGDDDQSIYKFRGAAISNILEFRDRYRSARTVVLRRNYRSLTPILDASYRLVRRNDPDRLEVRAAISKRLRAVRVADDEPGVGVEAFATHGEEADWIAAEIGRRVAAGARPRDHAVLVRANGHADPILRSLNVAGIPWRFSGTSGLYARPEVRRLLAFLRAVADPGSSVDVYSLATSEPYGLGGEDLTAIVNTARRRHRSVWDVLEELDRQPGILRVSEATRAAVGRLVADFRRYTQLAHERPAGEVGKPAFVVVTSSQPEVQPSSTWCPRMEKMCCRARMLKSAARPRRSFGSRRPRWASTCRARRTVRRVNPSASPRERSEGSRCPGRRVPIAISRLSAAAQVSYSDVPLSVARGERLRGRGFVRVMVEQLHWLPLVALRRGNDAWARPGRLPSGLARQRHTAHRAETAPQKAVSAHLAGAIAAPPTPGSEWFSMVATDCKGPPASLYFGPASSFRPVLTWK